MAFARPARQPRRTPAPPAPAPGGEELPYIEGVRFLTPQEAWDQYDQAARESLGISAEEFEAALARGEYADPDEDRRVLRLMFLQADRPPGSS